MHTRKSTIQKFWWSKICKQ